jgi:hypothetical protein
VKTAVSRAPKAIRTGLPWRRKGCGFASRRAATPCWWTGREGLEDRADGGQEREWHRLR